ncbi:MAG: hypothetical protein K6B72_02785 [Lachnospiraceae bacterium]|nr:hypothetical protein [Lachnospiraceae bacterium]
MKKKKTLLLVLFSILLCLVFTACGESKSSKDDDDEDEEETLSEDDFIGTWTDDETQLVLSDDGEGVFTLEGEDSDITWKLKGEKVTFKMDGDKYTCTINKKGKLKVEGGDGEYTLEKQKAKKNSKKDKNKKKSDDEDDDDDDDDDAKVSKKDKDTKDDVKVEPDDNDDDDDDDSKKKPDTKKGGTGMAAIAGYYKVIEMEQDGDDYAEYLDMLNQYGIYLYFTFNEDGTASMDMMGEHEDLLWDDTKIWSKGSETDAQPYVYKNDTLSIETDGVKMVLQRLSAAEEKTFLETGGQVDEEALMKMMEEMGSAYEN